MEACVLNMGVILSAGCYCGWASPASEAALHIVAVSTYSPTRKSLIVMTVLVGFILTFIVLQYTSLHKSVR